MTKKVSSSPLIDKVKPAAATNPYSPTLILAALTLLPLAAQLNLKWTDVDLDHRVLTIRGHKGGARRIPISHELAALLLNLPSRGKSPWVFPSASTMHGSLDGLAFCRCVFRPTVSKAAVTNRTWRQLRRCRQMRRQIPETTDDGAPS